CRAASEEVIRTVLPGFLLVCCGRARSRRPTMAATITRATSPCGWPAGGICGGIGQVPRAIDYFGRCDRRARPRLPLSSVLATSRVIVVAERRQSPTSFQPP